MKPSRPLRHHVAYHLHRLAEWIGDYERYGEEGEYLGGYECKPCQAEDHDNCESHHYDWSYCGCCS